MIASRYRAVLVSPGVVPLLMAGLVARLPFGMYSLAILLLVQRQTGSYAAAGAVTAAAAAGYAAIGPIQGRLVDRLGQTLPLAAGVAVNLAAFAALFLSAVTARPVWLLAACAAAVGASLPPIASCQRALWSSLLVEDAGLISTALALDAMQLDLFLILGPLAVAGIAATLGEPAAVAISAGMIAAGTVTFVLQPASRLWRSTGRTARLAGPLVAPGVRTLIATIAATGIALGAVRIALVAFAGQQGSISAGGLLLSTLGAGSLVGGLWYGSRAWRSPLHRRYALLLVLFAAGVLAMVLAPTLPVMAMLTVAGGLALAPVTVCEFQLVPRVAPAGSTTEAYAWTITSTFAGSALGNGIGGIVVAGSGWRGAVLLASAALASAGLLAWVRGRSLEGPGG